LLETKLPGRIYIWTSDALTDRVSAIKIAKEYRGAERPSDHVPVTATLEV
jgi:exodeoxyribonuclease-3